MIELTPQEHKIITDALVIFAEQNEIMKKALVFYGQHENWCQLIDGRYNLGKIWVRQDNYEWPGDPITTENGKRARQALEKIKELNK